MITKVGSKYVKRAAFLKAMAHPVRVMIIEELKKNELCVNEITEIAGLDISTVSKHLKLMKNEGILYDRKKGNCNYYYLRVSCITEFMKCLDFALDEVSPQCCPDHAGKVEIRDGKFELEK